MSELDVMAVDLEIGNQLSDFNAWRNHRPLNVTCVGLSYWCYTSGVTRQATKSFWSEIIGVDGVGEYLNCRATQNIVRKMLKWVKGGGVITTWNGLAFDLIVLADLSRMYDECKELALGSKHIDMMFNAFMALGHNVGLETASIETTGVGKYEGVKGSEAPALWQAGEHDRVLRYVERDAEMTRNLYQHLCDYPMMKWRTKSGLGNPRQLFARRGWSPVWSVEKTLRDVAPPAVADYMTNPPTLKQFIEVW